MSFFDSGKSIVENLYLLSGPILAVLGVGVFLQIKMAKKSIKTSENQITQAKEHLKIISKREAATIAAERVVFFLDVIIPVADKFSPSLEGFPELNIEGKAIEFSINEELDLNPEYSAAFFSKLKTSPTLLTDSLNLLNLLEGFAVYFIEEVASESLAFSSISLSYCSCVEKTYPLLAITREGTESLKPFTNLIKLYTLWKNRIHQYESDAILAAQEDALKAKKEELDFEREKQKRDFDYNNAPKPIGTND